MARRSRKKQRVPSLSEDLIVEILARVPYRSLCRFKCVSRSWLALCSDPDLRKKSPQTLSGFFCYPRPPHDTEDPLSFINLSGRGRPLVDPSPPSLEGYASRSAFVQCCSSLLLWEFRRLTPFDLQYVVSNPATREWILLPPTEDWHSMVSVCLGFDPAVPSCFYVFIFVMDESTVTGVKIYSSQTGGWIFRQSEWGDCTELNPYSEHVFFNGTLYLITTGLSLASIDTEGKTWRKIRMPHRCIRPKPTTDDSFIAHSQGRLYAMHMDYRNDNQLSVWALVADGNEVWTLEHTVNITRLLGRRHRSQDELYVLIAAHPERNLIFLTGGLRGELLSYDMDKQEVHAICTLQEYFLAPCFPYIPSFAEWSLPLGTVTKS